MSQIFFCLLPGVNGYGSVCHEPFPITNISSPFFFRRRGEGCHFRFRAPANHLASTFLPPWSGDCVRATRCHPSQVTVNSNSSHPTSIVSVGYHVTQHSLSLHCDSPSQHTHTHTLSLSLSLTHTHTLTSNGQPYENVYILQPFSFLFCLFG